MGKQKFFHEVKAFSEKIYLKSKKNKTLKQDIKNGTVQPNALLRIRLHSKIMLILCEASHPQMRMGSSLLRVRSSLACSCNVPGFDPSIRRHSGI